MVNKKGVNSAEVDMVANTSNPHQNSFNSQESNGSGLEVRMDNASGVSMQDNSGVNGAEEELLDEVSASGSSGEEDSQESEEESEEDLEGDVGEPLVRRSSEDEEEPFIGPLTELDTKIKELMDIPQDNYGNAEIGIGEDFQADIPDMIAPTGPPASTIPDRDQLIWKAPNDPKLRNDEEYWKQIRQFCLDSKRDHMFDPMSCLGMVTSNDYNIEKAKEDVKKWSTPYYPNFTDHEKAMFENGLEFHQKNFREIRKSMLPSRPLGDIIAHYYSTKTQKQLKSLMDVHAARLVEADPDSNNENDATIMKYGGEIAMMDILEEQGLLDWENPPMLNPNTWKQNYLIPPKTERNKKPTSAELDTARVLYHREQNMKPQNNNKHEDSKIVTLTKKQVQELRYFCSYQESYIQDGDPSIYEVQVPRPPTNIRGDLTDFIKDMIMEFPQLMSDDEVKDEKMETIQDEFVGVDDLLNVNDVTTNYHDDVKMKDDVIISKDDVLNGVLEMEVEIKRPRLS